MGPWGTIRVKVTGRGGIPASGVSAVAVNVTVTSPGTAENITVYAGGTSQPGTSNLNFTAGQTVPNLVNAPVGADGTIALTNNSGSTVHLIADTSGYHLAGPPPEPLSVVPGSFHYGTAGARYLEKLEATGGVAPLTWTAAGLPAGLTLSRDGTVSGFPLATGTSTATITVTDANGTSSGTTRQLNVPTAMPEGCRAAACAVLTASPRTLQVPAADIKSMARDNLTQRINKVTLAAGTVNGTAVSAGQVLVLAPGQFAESGAIVHVDTVAPYPDHTVTLTVTPTTPADAYTEGTFNSVDPSPTPATESLVTEATTLKCDAGVTATAASVSTTTSLTPSLFAGYELGACLACFWSDSPAKVTMLSGTFFNKRIATYDSVPSPAGTASPLALTATSPQSAPLVPPTVQCSPLQAAPVPTPRR